jgi:hypothetical protein
LGYVLEIWIPSTFREFQGKDAETLQDLKSQNPESKLGPSILRGCVAMIETFRKNPDRQVHRHIRIRCFADLEDRKHFHFEVAKSKILKGGKLCYGAQLTSSCQTEGSGISMMKPPKQT